MSDRNAFEQDWSRALPPRIDIAHKQQSMATPHARPWNAPMAHTGSTYESIADLPSQFGMYDLSSHRQSNHMHSPSDQETTASSPDPFTLAIELGRARERAERAERRCDALEHQLDQMRIQLRSAAHETYAARTELGAIKERANRDPWQRPDTNHSQNNLQSPLRTPGKSSTTPGSGPGSGHSSERAGMMPMTPETPASSGADQAMPHVHRNAMPYTPTPLVARLRLSSSPPATPGANPARLLNESLADNLAAFFGHIEQWAKRYANVEFETASPTAVTASAVNVWLGICKPRDLEEIMVDTALRPFLAVAVINFVLLRRLGTPVVDGFKSPDTTEADAVATSLARVKPVNARAIHDLLMRRKGIFERITADPAAVKWLDNQVVQSTAEIMRLVTPMIPSKAVVAATSDMSKLVKRAFQIGQRMALCPSEFSIAEARRSERWDSHIMSQRDDRRANDPRLTGGNGFSFVVQLGVAPSVTEREFSSGSMRVQTLHQRSVLLTENQNQKVPRR